MNDDQLPLVIVSALVSLLFTAGLYVLLSIALSKLFVKLGEDGWKAWVPVLNTIVILRLGGQSALWTIALFIPVANVVGLVFYYLAIHAINKRMGKGGGYTVLAVFLYIVWVCILGFSSARPAPEEEPAAPPHYAAFSALAPTLDAVQSSPLGAPPIAGAAGGPTSAVPVAPGPPPPFAAPAAPPFGAPPAPAAPANSMWSAPPPPPVWATPATPPGSSGRSGASSASASPAPTPDDRPQWTPPANDLTAAQHPSGDQPSPSGRIEVPDAVRLATQSPAAAPTATPAPASPSAAVSPSVPASAAVSAAASASASASASAAAPASASAPASDEPEFSDELEEESTVISGRRFTPWVLETDGDHRTVIERPVVILGRNPAADPAFPDAQLVSVRDGRKTVSKSHARIVFAAGAWTVTDLSSTNGVVLIAPSGEETEIESGVTVALTPRFLLGELPTRLFTEGA